MGILLFLSKSGASTGLDWSEVFLLIFGLMVAVGVLGESAKSEKWKKWHRTFELLVIIGVAGELLADGAIFVFSKHLQAISDAELQAVTRDVGDTHRAAEKSALAASQAQDSAKQAIDEAKNSEHAAQNAKSAAQLASLEFTRLGERAIEAGERVVKLENQLGWRSLSKVQKVHIRAALLPFSGTKIEISSAWGDAEGGAYADDFADVIRKSNWAIYAGGPSIRSFNGAAPQGLWIRVTDLKNNPAAARLQQVLKEVGIAAEGEKFPDLRPGEDMELFVGIKPRTVTPTNNEK